MSRLVREFRCPLEEFDPPPRWQATVAAAMPANPPPTMASKGRFGVFFGRSVMLEVMEQNRVLTHPARRSPPANDTPSVLSVQSVSLKWPLDDFDAISF